MKGSYILVIELKEDKIIQIGKLGKIFFKKGFYIYVGSALNGLEQRINRHLRKTKKKHWHIDYLLKYAKIIDVFYKESGKREECKIAEILGKQLVAIHHFGCSDCRCKSHLFYESERNIVKIVDKLGMIVHNI
ncbi:MAG: GIY-YIG nuclease family protein [Thermoplasmatota archaeon]|jgi:Uri superfamily endonuclease